MKRTVRIDMPKGHRPRAQGMFDTAIEFQEAAMRAAEPSAGPAKVAPLAPMIACFALAAELYLKTLLVVEGRAAPKQHRLNVLFMLLPPSVQTEVARETTGLLGISEAELVPELQQLGAAFVDWRYIFDAEGRDISLSTLIELCRALYRTILARRPDWQPTAYLARRMTEEPAEYPLHIFSGEGGVFVKAIGHRTPEPPTFPDASR